MNEKTKEICVLGGLYFVIGYIIDLVGGFASNLSTIFFILFVILFFYDFIWQESCLSAKIYG